MKKRGVPVVYYVAPQFWAWRQGRVKLLRKYIGKALVIFPFEEKFYRDRGVDASFVGHPLAGLPPRRSCATLRRPIPPGPTKLDHAHAGQPAEGSPHEPARPMLDAATLLGAGFEFLLPVAPTLNREFLEQEHCGTRHHACLGSSAGAASRPRGIVASGTATVEAAMMATPFVMVYRVSALTYMLGKPRMKVPYFAMVNLIAGEKIVPELVQDDFTAERVVARLKELLRRGLPENHAGWLAG